MDVSTASSIFDEAIDNEENGDSKKAIDLLKTIQYPSEILYEQDDEILEWYDYAQLYIAYIADYNNDLDTARQHYKNVKGNSSNAFNWAQAALARNYFDDRNYNEVMNCIKNISIRSEAYIDQAYEIVNMRNICLIKGSSLRDIFAEIYEIIQLTLHTLFVDNRYEQSIAHYTTLNVAKLLLANKNQAKKPKAVFEPKSKLRLNTINLMNDPEEGLLINKLFCLEAWMNRQDLAFITCFTLHHDSLNQFRLYGKQDQQEASGLSCVLDKQFFSPEHNTLSMFRKNEDSPLKKLLGMTHEKCLDKMPLYRCIYLDPTSGLIKVAQREEWSFHREYKKEDKVSILEPNPEAEQHWKEYQNEILEIESRVSGHLKELVEQVKLLNPKDLSDEEKELLAEILLPLRYLIKHMAFKEEQECRMIYVTQMDNPLIQYDENLNRIYIDYEPSVMEHLEKIYLAPKAKDEKMVFEYLCSRGQEFRTGKSPVKVKISQNPFR